MATTALRVPRAPFLFLNMFAASATNKVMLLPNCGTLLTLENPVQMSLPLGSLRHLFLAATTVE